MATGMKGTAMISAGVRVAKRNGSLLHLMHLVSPALPVGAYAYSQGLEYAVESGWVTDQAKLQGWLGGVMRESLARVDIPVLLRLHHAWSEPG